jgi:hypothetical protein
MEVSSQLRAPAALLPGKSPWNPLYKRLGGPQSRFGRGGEEKNSHTLPGLESPIIQPVAQRYTTELSRLLPCDIYDYYLLFKYEFISEALEKRLIYWCGCVTSRFAVDEKLLTLMQQNSDFY